MNVDILVTGHTHKCSVEQRDGGFFINPGSATGAVNGFTGESYQPSFVLLDIQGANCMTYIYKLKDDNEVDVEKIEYRKEVAVGGL